MIKKTAVAVIVSLLCQCSIKAQQKNNVAIIKEFMEICNNYRKIPLQLSLEYNQGTNYILDKSDTGSVKANFILDSNKSYMQFGEIEEMANDSTALIISNPIKHMTLFKNTKQLQQQLQKMTGMILSDSMILKWNEKYKATKSNISTIITEIKLSSRTLLKETNFSEEEIKMLFNSETNEPEQVTKLTRQLVSIDSTVYQQLLIKPTMEEKLIVTKKNKYYVVKEQISTYIYKNIQHQTGILVPDIAERIRKNEQGQYVSINKYSQYQISTNIN
ncbi:hypothetical protein [Ferruginibacter albus]|uniref:hypothetical protein n=1 Tax=Ferruginibacter albus TaxID=2875540 RepID=UPI001CC61D07|nr:hypothetical protein [Ferruginibacter albus]UAY53239.1 hypothetical protein K9M53_06100 [Ferruginibacter albus]